MEYYITQPKDYWIAPNAVNITLNALGDKNRIHGSVASGAVIMCFVESIKAENAGGEAGNGDGLWYGRNHEPKRWPLTISPTYFNSDTRKYVYVAIPRSTTVGTQAMIVFPSEQLDIYGRVLVDDSSDNSSDDSSSDERYVQVGSTDYFYVWLNGIIGAADAVTVGRREWEDSITDREWGLLETSQGREEQAESGKWYTFAAGTVTFLKKIVMSPASLFHNLIIGSGSAKGELNGVAKQGVTTEKNGWNSHIVTPSYLDEFGNTHYLRKDIDDEAEGNIGFLNGLWIGVKKKYYIAADGVASLYQLFADRIITHFIQVEDMKSANYTGDGMADTGWRLSNNHNGHSKLTIDELYVRMKAVFESLEVRERTYTGGDQIWSCAGNYVSRTDYLKNNGKSYYVDEEGVPYTDPVDEDDAEGQAAAREEAREITEDGGPELYNVPVAGEAVGYSTVEVPWMLRGAAMILGRNSGIIRGLYSRYAKVRIVIPEAEEAPAESHETSSFLSGDGIVDTPAINKIRRVRCYFLAKDDDREIHNWWRINDLARCQTMNLANTNRETYIGGRTTKAGNVFWWRKVIGVSKDPVQLDDGKWYHFFDVAFDNEIEESSDPAIHGAMATFAMEGSDIPAATDSVVQFGNTVNPGRMNLMMMEVNGGDAEVGYAPTGDAPCLKAYRGIYCFDLSKCWVGGRTCKMKLSPTTGYEFYGPNFKQVTEYDVVPVPVDRGLWTDICRKKNAAGAYINEWEFNTDDYARTEETPYSDDATTLRDYSSFVDGEGHVAAGAPVRKCYYYDKVSHNGRYWLCSIVDGEHWVQPIEAGGVTVWRYISDSAYAALTLEQKTKCARRQNYTIEEPSEASADWTTLVEKGTDGGTPESRYQWNNSDTQAPPLDATDPTATTPDNNWTVNAPNRPTTPGEWYLWMVTAIKYADGSYGTWGDFVRLTGEKGTAGEDGTDMEYIYILKTQETTFGGATSDNPMPSVLDKGEVSPGNHAAGNSVDYDNTTDDWVPYQWWDNPQGIDATNKFEYMSWRQKPKGSSTWSAFSDPIVWSHFGKNGMDGDGVEYVFIRTKTDVAPQILDNVSSASPYNNYNRHDSSASGGRTHDEDEYLPLAYITSGTAGDIEANDVETVSGGTPGMYGECTDDPKGTDYTWRYEWVIMRRMTAPNASGERQWTYFAGTMSQWSNFAKGYTIDNRAKTTSTIDPNYYDPERTDWSNGDIVILNSSGFASAIAIYTNGIWEGADVAPGSNFLCEADGHVYQWNGTIWIDLGQYEGDSTYAMTPENLIINQPITGGNPVPTGSPEVVELVVSSGEDEWSVGHGLTLSNVVVSETLPSGATSIGSTQVSINSNGKLQIISIGGYRLTPGGAAQYYDRVDISVDLTFVDGVLRTITRTLHVYVNMIGKFKTIIQGDTETSVASKLEAAIDGTEEAPTNFTYAGTYIRSASEKTDTLDKQIYGNNLLPADGWTDVDGILVGTDNFDIDLQELHGNVYSAIFFLRAGQYTYSHYCSSPVTLNILTSEGRKETPSEMTVGGTSYSVSDERQYKSDGHTEDTYESTGRRYVDFTLLSDVYVCLKINATSYDIFRPMLEKGTDVHDWETGAIMRTSQIKQTAEQIDLNIRSGLDNTGIDITNGEIQLRANVVKFTNSDGTVDDKISIDPTNGTLHAVDGDFDGTVRARNLFHSVCIVGKEEYFYCTQTFLDTYHKQSWIDEFTLGEYYTSEQIYELSNHSIGDGIVANGMVACTCMADIVLCPNLHNNSNPRYVKLPCAKDFEGKIVEVIDNAYTNGQPMGDIEVSAVDGGKFGSGMWSSGVAYLDTYVPISPEGRCRFYSIYDQSVWWWLKLD